MNLVSFFEPQRGAQLGLLRDGGVWSLTRLDDERFRSGEHLIVEAERAGVSPLAWVREAAARLGPQPDLSWEALAAAPVPADGSSEAREPYLLPPLRPVEVWASGVTYARSRDARESETTVRNIYDKVYEAERPELFLKATGQRVVGPNDYVGIRSDSSWQVPEAELGLVLNGQGEIVGITAGNDMSSRDIEGENPLYLPQAKIFRHSCSLGPTVRLLEGPPPPLSITCRIWRGGTEVFSGTTSTSQLKRTYEELVGFLRRDNVLYTPTVLLTGTGIVPPDEFTLQDGDLIEIDVEQIGVLRNRVKQL